MSEEVKTAVHSKESGDSVAVEEGISKNWTDEEEKRVVRKLDMVMIPWCLTMYFFSFLNRVNIGNARVVGFNASTNTGQFERDTGMTANDFNIAVTVFFITYVLGEPASNLIMNVVKPNVWLARIMVTWGIFSACLGAVQNFAGVVSLRLLLGLAEAGLFPGIAYMLSFFYRRHEYAFRVALFFGGAGIGSAFSGALAFGISQMDGAAGLSAWRWIFIMEGIPTIILGVMVYFFVPAAPGAAKFLNERERAIAEDRLRLDPATAADKVYDKTKITATLKNPLVWASALLFFFYTTPGYALTFFAPTILQAIGYTGVTANLFSVPPLITGPLALFIISYMSDKYKDRSAPMLFCVLLMAGSYLGLAITRNGPLAYGLLFMSSIGNNGAIPLSIALLSNNLISHTERSLGLGLMMGLGNIGGIIAGQIFRFEDRPWYSGGHYTLLAFSLAACVLIVGIRLYIAYLNKKHQKAVSEREAKGETITEFEKRFTYQK